MGVLHCRLGCRPPYGNVDRPEYNTTFEQYSLRNQFQRLYPGAMVTMVEILLIAVAYPEQPNGMKIEGPYLFSML